MFSLSFLEKKCTNLDMSKDENGGNCVGKVFTIISQQLKCKSNHYFDDSCVLYKKQTLCLWYNMEINKWLMFLLNA